MAPIEDTPDDESYRDRQRLVDGDYDVNVQGSLDMVDPNLEAELAPTSSNAGSPRGEEDSEAEGDVLGQYSRDLTEKPTTGFMDDDYDPLGMNSTLEGFIKGMYEVYDEGKEEGEDQKKWDVDRSTLSSFCRTLNSSLSTQLELLQARLAGEIEKVGMKVAHEVSCFERSECGRRQTVEDGQAAAMRSARKRSQDAQRLVEAENASMASSLAQMEEKYAYLQALVRPYSRPSYSRASHANESRIAIPASSRNTGSLVGTDGMGDETEDLSEGRPAAETISRVHGEGRLQPVLMGNLQPEKEMAAVVVPQGLSYELDIQEGAEVEYLSMPVQSAAVGGGGGGGGAVSGVGGIGDGGGGGGISSNGVQSALSSVESTLVVAPQHAHTTSAPPMKTGSAQGSEEVDSNIPEAVSSGDQFHCRGSSAVGNAALDLGVSELNAKRKGLVVAQHQLLTVHHVGSCTHGECKFHKCSAMKITLNHTMMCTNPKCEWNDCISLRTTLHHYDGCMDKECEICRDVRVITERSFQRQVEKQVSTTAAAAPVVHDYAGSCCSYYDANTMDYLSSLPTDDGRWDSTLDHVTATLGVCDILSFVDHHMARVDVRPAIAMTSLQRLGGDTRFIYETAVQVMETLASQGAMSVLQCVVSSRDDDILTQALMYAKQCLAVLGVRATAVSETLEKLAMPGFLSGVARALDGKVEGRTVATTAVSRLTQSEDSANSTRKASQPSFLFACQPGSFITSSTGNSMSGRGGYSSSYPGGPPQGLAVNSGAHGGGVVSGKGLFVNRVVRRPTVSSVVDIRSGADGGGGGGGNNSPHVNRTTPTHDGGQVKSQGAQSSTHRGDTSVVKGPVAAARHRWDSPTWPKDVKRAAITRHGDRASPNQQQQQQQQHPPPSSPNSSVGHRLKYVESLSRSVAAVQEQRPALDGGDIGVSGDTSTPRRRAQSVWVGGGVGGVSSDGGGSGGSGGSGVISGYCSESPVKMGSARSGGPTSMASVVPVASSRRDPYHRYRNGVAGDIGSGRMYWDLLREIQNRVVVLIHASTCRDPECKFRRCPDAKVLFAHIQNCPDPLCETRDCYRLRGALVHFHHCRDDPCDLCTPLREIFDSCCKRKIAIQKKTRRANEAMNQVVDSAARVQFSLGARGSDPAIDAALAPVAPRRVHRQQKAQATHRSQRRAAGVPTCKVAAGVPRPQPIPAARSAFVFTGVGKRGGVAAVAHADRNPIAGTSATPLATSVGASSRVNTSAGAFVFGGTAQRGGSGKDGGQRGGVDPGNVAHGGSC